MAGVRHLFDDSIVLVDDPSVCWPLAGTEAISLSRAASRLDGNVGGDGGDYSALAERGALLCGLGTGAGGSFVRHGVLHLFALRKKLQRETTWRSAGGAWRQSRATPCHRWNSRARPASRVPGASLRDAGLERGDRPSRMLGADGVRGGHRCPDDPDGGRGTRTEVWRCLSRVSQLSSWSHPTNLIPPPAIIRCDRKLMADC